MKEGSWLVWGCGVAAIVTLFGCVAFALPARFRELAWEDVLITVLSYRDTTEYAPRFSEEAFDEISVGMNAVLVEDKLGPPLWKTWIYTKDDVYFHLGRVSWLTKYPGVREGMTPHEVQELLGIPPRQHWLYTWGQKAYRERVIMFRRGKVIEKKRNAWLP